MVNLGAQHAPGRRARTALDLSGLTYPISGRLLQGASAQAPDRLPELERLWQAALERSDQACRQGSF